ncbi:MAG: hypothetical protein ABI477_06695 [Chryseolinea sp.]
MTSKLANISKELNGGRSFLSQVVIASWCTLFLAIIYQLIFFPDLTNAVAISAVVIAWILATNVWLRKDVLEKYPLSTFMAFGFAASQLYLPLIFTTIENKPLIYNLEFPEEVFLHSILGLAVLVAAHILYRFLIRITPDRKVSLFAKAGFFKAPTELQIWVMGVIGMAATTYVYFANPDIGREVTGAASDKFFQALVPFCYAPFFIPLAKLYGGKEKTHSGYTVMIIAYAILLFGLSIARNSRGAFIFGLTTPAFAYILGLLMGIFKTKIFTIRNFVVVGFVTWLLVGPFTDLGVAMLLVRGQRTDITPAELITQTLQTLDDKDAIKRRKEDDKTESMDFDWDERYLDNLFTARFSNIKFNDSNYITYSKLGDYDPDMQEYSLDQILSALPDPVIKLFKFQVDKEETLATSIGDYMYILSGGHGTPAGFRSGSIAGTGMAAFGWWYLGLLGLLSIPAFYINDKLFRRKKILDPVDNLNHYNYVFSFAGILTLTSCFQFYTMESVVQIPVYFIRTWPQMMLLYFMIFQATRVISRLFGSRKRHYHFQPN